MEQIFTYGFQGLVAYGIVGGIDLVLRKRFNQTLESDIKLILLITIAFALGFVPEDLGNQLFEQLKVAISIGFGISALNTGIKRFAGTE